MIPKRRADRDAMLADARYAGMLKEVADDLGVSKASVSLAWHRPRTSKRIRLAIERKIAARSAAEEIAV